MGAESLSIIDKQLQFAGIDGNCLPTGFATGVAIGVAWIGGWGCKQQLRTRRFRLHAFVGCGCFSDRKRDRATNPEGYCRQSANHARKVDASRSHACQLGMLRICKANHEFLNV